MSSSNVIFNHKIPTSIIDIIRESKNHCFIVTPYYQPWTQLIRTLELAASQNKRIFFLFREDQTNNRDIYDLNNEFDFDVMFIKNLHAKIYINERRGLISSMNLYDHSKENNYEIGYLISNKKDIEEIIENIILKDMISIWQSEYLEGRYYDYISNMMKSNSSLDNKRSNINYRKVSNTAFCIRCRENIKYNFDKPMCNECFSEWSFYKNYEYTEDFCLNCGKEYETSMSRPLCLECFKSMTNVLDRKF